MNNITIGKRIPIGAAVGGLCTFSFTIWNMLYPDLQFSVSAVGGISAALTAIVQVLVVNTLGVTNVRSSKK